MEVGKGEGASKGEERESARERLCDGGGDSSLVNAPQPPNPQSSKPPSISSSSRIPVFGATAETKRFWRREHTLECAQACVLRMSAPRVFLFLFSSFFMRGPQHPTEVKVQVQHCVVTVSEARAPRAPRRAPPSRLFLSLSPPTWICLLFTAEGCVRHCRLTPPPARPSHRLTRASPAAPGDSSPALLPLLSGAAPLTVVAERPRNGCVASPPTVINS